MSEQMNKRMNLSLGKHYERLLWARSHCGYGAWERDAPCLGLEERIAAQETRGRHGERKGGREKPDRPGFPFQPILVS